MSLPSTSGSPGPWPMRLLPVTPSITSWWRPSSRPTWSPPAWPASSGLSWRPAARPAWRSRCTTACSSRSCRAASTALRPAGWRSTSPAGTCSTPVWRSAPSTRGSTAATGSRVCWAGRSSASAARALFERLAQRFAGGSVAVVGHFPHLEPLSDHCTLTILERHPSGGDLPDQACEYLLPRQDCVCITGSAVSNKTLPRLLELSRDAYVVLVGPSVPLTTMWFDYGVDLLAGTVVLDPASPSALSSREAAARSSATASPWSSSRQWTLRRADASPQPEAPRCALGAAEPPLTMAPSGTRRSAGSSS